MAGPTFAVNFTVRKTKKNSSLANVYAVITMDGDKPAEISLAGKIEHCKWDGKSEKVKGNTPDIKSLNIHIDNVRVNITVAYRELIDLQESFNAQDVKAQYLGERAAANKDYTILKILEKHGKEWRRKLKPGSLKNYDATEAYLKNFIKYRHAQKKKVGDDMPVSAIDYAFLSDFEYYIPNHPLKKHDPCNHNGTAKHLERVKKLAGWAYELGWTKRNKAAKFIPHTEDNPRAKLKYHQIALIQQKKLLSPELRLIRDMFVFSLYTGMSFAEVSKLCIHHFEVSASGKFFCTMYRTKSGEPFAVPMLPEAVKIVRRYMDSTKSQENGTIFPKITNQQVNRGLKIIQEAVFIPIPLRFHLARHTFAKVIALQSGVPITTIQIILGHKKLETTMIYAEVDEETVERDVDQLEEVLQRRNTLPSPENYIKRIPLQQAT